MVQQPNQSVHPGRQQPNELDIAEEEKPRPTSVHDLQPVPQLIDPTGHAKCCAGAVNNAIHEKPGEPRLMPPVFDDIMIQTKKEMCKDQKLISKIDNFDDPPIELSTHAEKRAAVGDIGQYDETGMKLLSVPADKKHKHHHRTHKDDGELIAGSSSMDKSNATPLMGTAMPSSSAVDHKMEDKTHVPTQLSTNSDAKQSDVTMGGTSSAAMQHNDVTKLEHKIHPGQHNAMDTGTDTSMIAPEKPPKPTHFTGTAAALPGMNSSATGTNNGTGSTAMDVVPPHRV